MYSTCVSIGVQQESDSSICDSVLENTTGGRKGTSQLFCVLNLNPKEDSSLYLLGVNKIIKGTSFKAVWMREAMSFYSLDYFRLLEVNIIMK